MCEVGQPHLPASPLSKGSSCKEPGSVAGFFPSNTLTEWTHVILGTCKVHLPNSTNRALDKQLSMISEDFMGYRMGDWAANDFRNRIK